MTRLHLSRVERFHPQGVDLTPWGGLMSEDRK